MLFRRTYTGLVKSFVHFTIPSLAIVHHASDRRSQMPLSVRQAPPSEEWDGFASVGHVPEVTSLSGSAFYVRPDVLATARMAES